VATVALVSELVSSLSFVDGTVGCAT